MNSLELMIQFRLICKDKYVGSISFQLQDIFKPNKDFKQW